MPIGYQSTVSDIFDKENNTLQDNYSQMVEIYGLKNGFRVKNYHRLDISANFSKKKRRGTRVWSVGVYNVYNRKNVTFYHIETDENGKRKVFQQSYFPFIPNISYSIKF